MKGDPTDATSAHGPDTTDQQRAHHLLEVVEYIAQTLDGPGRGLAKLPTREDVGRHLHTSPEDVDAALGVLHWRGLLTTQQDTITGDTPLLPAASGPGKRRARHIVADKIAFRIKLGIWNGDAFPTVEAMRDQFRCGLHTLCDALQILKDQGVVHKALVTVERPHPARDYLWRPVEVAGQDPHAFTRQLTDAILAGELTGELPCKAEMAERHGVSPPTAAAAYDRLQHEGLIAKAWKQGNRSYTWYVVSGGPPEGLLPGDTKPLAIARAIIDRTPYWLSQLPDGTWARRWVPYAEALKRDYGADRTVIRQAVQLLVDLQIFEQTPLPQKRYVPRPPADRGKAYGLTFREHKRRKRRWERASDPVEWLPFPTSGEDPIVRAVHDRLSRNARDLSTSTRESDDAYASAEAVSSVPNTVGFALPGRLAARTEDG